MECEGTLPMVLNNKVTDAAADMLKLMNEDNGNDTST